MTFTEEGEETITVTGATAQGCDSIVTLHVTVNPTLYGDYYSTICDSQLPYEWHGVTFTEEGEETITVTGATTQGCDSIAHFLSYLLPQNYFISVVMSLLLSFKEMITRISMQFLIIS